MYMTHDYHELHIYAGHYIAFDVYFHGLFHIFRWISQGNVSLLWKSTCGFSGLIVLVVTPLITIPMMYMKDRIPYEIRKNTHYLFHVFAIGLCFHVPTSGIPNGGFLTYVLGSCIVLYSLDATYVFFFMTERVETTIFQLLPNGGVKMSMDVSDRFIDNIGSGGMVYVCLPWVDKNQWHAFSLFDHPTIVNRREVLMAKAGDWTTAVYRALQRETVRPVWVCGPFESPYNHGISYDNQILVATGIGITPALSIIKNYKEHRRINLIWICKNASMLEFFMEHFYLEHEGWNLIFYTGKDRLSPAIDELNSNVLIIKKRPDLKSVIPNIIYGIESGKGLPEKRTMLQKEHVLNLITRQSQALENVGAHDKRSKMKELMKTAKSNGFLMKVKKRMSTSTGQPVSRRMGTSEIGALENMGLERTFRLSCLQMASRFDPISSNKNASDYTRRLHPVILETWGILYCGGNQIIVNILKEISEEFKLDLIVESFKW